MIKSYLENVKVYMYFNGYKCAEVYTKIPSLIRHKYRELFIRDAFNGWVCFVHEKDREKFIKLTNEIFEYEKGAEK